MRGTSHSTRSGRRIVVMGVSGAGKTVVGERLAARLGMEFVDADDLHPDANKDKLRSGTPLTDEDRWPWLDAVGRRLAAGPVVVACSALKRSYRDRIRGHAPGTIFVLLDGPGEVLERRVLHRSHPFMPAALLASQLATLERLDADEAGFVASFEPDPDTIVDLVIGRLPPSREAGGFAPVSGG